MALSTYSKYFYEKIKLALSYPTTVNSHRKREALVEVERRGATGIFVYSIVWIIISLTTNFYSQHTRIFFAVGSLWAAIATLRFILHLNFKRIASENTNRARSIYLTMLFVSVFCLSLLMCASLTTETFAVLRVPFLIICSAVCASVTLELSIDPAIRYCLPPILLGPVAICSLMTSTYGSSFLFFLIIVFIIHLYITSHSLSLDYWNGIATKELLKDESKFFKNQSQTDFLTQIPNRSHFEKELTSKWQSSQRTGVGIGLMIIDVDHFKLINDQFGHLAGDSCLVAVANDLRINLSRSSDILGRFGGEEFVAAVDLRDTNDAKRVANHLRISISALKIISGQHEIQVTCSIGMVIITSAMTGIDPTQALMAADRALYVAKASGRNRVEVATELRMR